MYVFYLVLMDFLISATDKRTQANTTHIQAYYDKN